MDSMTPSTKSILCVTNVTHRCYNQRIETLYDIIFLGTAYLQVQCLDSQHDLIPSSIYDNDISDRHSVTTLVRNSAQYPIHESSYQNFYTERSRTQILQLTAYPVSWSRLYVYREKQDSSSRREESIQTGVQQLERDAQLGLDPCLIYTNSFLISQTLAVFTGFSLAMASPSSARVNNFVIW